MNPLASAHITIASLDDGRLVEYDSASKSSLGYEMFMDEFEYLGTGIIYSVNGKVQKFLHSNPNDIYNFWKSK